MICYIHDREDCIECLRVAWEAVGQMHAALMKPVRAHPAVVEFLRELEGKTWPEFFSVVFTRMSVLEEWTMNEVRRISVLEAELQRLREEGPQRENALLHYENRELRAEIQKLLPTEKVYIGCSETQHNQPLARLCRQSMERGPGITPPPEPARVLAFNQEDIDLLAPDVSNAEARALRCRR